MTTDVDQYLEGPKLKSEDPGFFPLTGQGDGQFFFCISESTLVQTCLYLTPPSRTARTKICAHVKYPISIYCTRVGLTADGMETRKHTGNETWVAPNYGCSLPSGKVP